MQNLSFEANKEVSLHNQFVCEENHGVDVVKRWYFDWVSVLFCYGVGTNLVPADFLSLCFLCGHTTCPVFQWGQQQGRSLIQKWELFCRLSLRETSPLTFNVDFCVRFSITICLDSAEREMIKSAIPGKSDLCVMYSLSIGCSLNNFCRNSESSHISGCAGWVQSTSLEGAWSPLTSEKFW